MEFTQRRYVINDGNKPTNKLTNGHVVRREHVLRNGHVVRDGHVESAGKFHDQADIVKNQLLIDSNCKHQLRTKSSQPSGDGQAGRGLAALRAYCYIPLTAL
jgi:hypothetical protein